MVSAGTATKLGRAAVAAALGCVVALGLAGGTTVAAADAAVAPKDDRLTIVGAGWGHGRGMSQYGAWGAASKGLSHREILAFYYPGTKLEQLPADNVLRVWISADTDGALHFAPATGQLVTDSAGRKLTLPVGTKYTRWRISRSGTSSVLAYRDPGGRYVKQATGLDPDRVWYVTNRRTGLVKLVLPDATTRTYRGRLALKFGDFGARTVNHVDMESYLRSVVPAEMPASWAMAAVRAQAVAARTYAARLRSAAPDGAAYDLCDTSSCQVYKGYQRGSTGYEHPRSDQAIASTRHQVLTYRGRPALTEFSAANGGWSASGGSGHPYQKAQRDPYDGLKRDQAWTVTLTAAAIQRAYPALGTLKSVQVTDRDGAGPYGGRVETIRLVGSKASVNLTGGAFKRAFGLKERLFKVVAGVTLTGASR